MRRKSERGRGLVLIFMDVDDLKGINDRFGHAEGDEVLKCTATVLKENFRGSDVVGRVGGDEFVVLALEASEQSLDLLRRRLQERLKKAKCCEVLKSSLSISAGAIYYDPKEPCSIDELLRKADMAMYETKGYREGSDDPGQ